MERDWRIFHKDGIQILCSRSSVVSMMLLVQSFGWKKSMEPSTSYGLAVTGKTEVVFSEMDCEFI
jgi:hypothetical protein